MCLITHEYGIIISYCHHCMYITELLSCSHTFNTIAVFKFVLVSLAISVPLPRQNLVDERFHDECYQNFKDHQNDDVETQKI